MEVQELQKSDWFASLIEECRAIIIEHEFTSRWTIIEGYHALGKRISEDNNNFEREQIYGKKIVQSIAETIGKSERTVYQAIKFYEKYPDLSLLPEAKNTSWHKITQKYLPQAKENEEDTVQKKTSEQIINTPTTAVFPVTLLITYSKNETQTWQPSIDNESLEMLGISGLRDLRDLIDEYLSELCS